MSVNTTLDGLSVQDGRYNLGINSATRINPDLVGEIRLIVAPVDAETGRGSGQVQILTKSGTNRYHRKRGVECPEHGAECQYLEQQQERQHRGLDEPAAIFGEL